jgi:phosphoribosylamine--glycine ligase
MASGGYPGSYDTGKPISGLAGISGDSQVFHAGTVEGEDGTVLTAGGRVLDIVATGSDIFEARATVYAATRAINFEGAEYRRDIATRAVKSPAP